MTRRELRKARGTLPPVFGTGDLARVLGWSVIRVRRFCQRRGLGTDDKQEHKRILLTYSILLEKVPEIYYALVTAGAIGTTHDEIENEQ